MRTLLATLLTFPLLGFAAAGAPAQPAVAQAAPAQPAPAKPPQPARPAARPVPARPARTAPATPAAPAKPAAPATPAAPAAPAAAASPAASVAADEARLREIKTTLWPRAYREQDVELLGRILHPRFQSIDADGTVTRRDDELDWVRGHKPSYTDFRYEIERLDIFDGRFAIVSGQGIVEGAGESGPEETRYRSSNHFIKEAGEWRAVSSHVSGVKSTSLAH